MPSNIGFDIGLNNARIRRTVHTVDAGVTPTGYQRRTALTVAETDTEFDDRDRGLPRYRADDTPPPLTVLLFGFQQVMVCVSALVVAPILITDIICVRHLPWVRVQLIATAMFTAGIATLLQSTLGVRLALLQGPSFAFLPAITSFVALSDYTCSEVTAANVTNITWSDNYLARNSTFGGRNTEPWEERLQTLQGSLLATSLVQIVIGATGAIGVVTKFIGPLTIAPLMLLLEISTVGLCLENVAKHGVSVVLIIALLITTLYISRVQVPLPCCGGEQRCHMTAQPQPVFALFPYLIAITIIWLGCAIATQFNWWSADSVARTDVRNSVIADSHWFSLPYPGQWGRIRFDVGLFLGFVAATLASVVESIGDYHACARASDEPSPPMHAVNRGILVEGIGCFIAGLLGLGVGVTTYSENIGVIGITRVASRRTMQMGGALLIILGVFTKFGAIMSTIPDPLVGAILTVGGVGLSSIQLVDLKLSRNIAILGFSIMIGIMLSRYIKETPVNTGVQDLDQMLNILLSIEMFVGGTVGFILDNTVPGATREQRGLRPLQEQASAVQPRAGAYGFSGTTMRCIGKLPTVTRYLAFMPNFGTTTAPDTTY